MVDPRPLTDDRQLEQRLDALLAGLAECEPDLVSDASAAATVPPAAEPLRFASPRPAADAAEAAEAAATAVAAAPEPAAATELPTAAAPHAGEDELAAEIQAMLDSPSTVCHETAATRDQDAGSLERTAVDGSAKTVDPSDHAERQAAEAGDEPPIAVLDDQLAHAADDAVAGAFETVAEVVATSKSESEVPTEPTAPKVDPSRLEAAAAGPADGVSARSLASGPPAGATDDAVAEVDPDTVAGSFESPEQLLLRETAAVAGAEPSGPSPDPAAASSGPEASATPATPAAPAAPAPVAAADIQPQPATLVHLCERSLRQFLGRINRPLDFAPPLVRQTVGLVGLVTLFNGCAMLIWTVLHLG